MRINVRKISPRWLVLGLISAVAVLVVGCQGNQTKLDLPSPTGAPAYLLSVDAKSNVNIFSPEGKPWQECKSKTCQSLVRVDDKVVQRVFEGSMATGGFLLLTFDDIKTAKLINFNLIPKAHAQATCDNPLIISRPGRMTRVIYPPGCPLP